MYSIRRAYKKMRLKRMRRRGSWRRLDGVVYNDTPQIEKLVFIGGLHRSGTTMLENLIMKTFDVSVLRAQVPENEGQHLQNVYLPASEYGGPGRFAFSDQMFRDPRAVAGATQKWSNTSLAELMMHWNVAYSFAWNALRKDDCFLLRYEDLVTDPEGKIAEIGQFCGLRRRQTEAQGDRRYARIQNSNGKYTAMHECRSYGAGIWDRYGYKP